MFLFNLEIDSIYIIGLAASRPIFVPVIHGNKWQYDVNAKEYK